MSDFVSKTGDLANGLFIVIKIIWWIALFSSIIAFLISVATMVIHSGDSPRLKDEARHDIFAAIISILVLSFIGIIYSIIIAIVMS